MPYINARDVLPPDLLARVQEYVDGARVYVPRASGQRRSWGTRSGARRHLGRRNDDIRDRYGCGESVHDLAQRYHLSPERVRAIIRSPQP